MRALGGIWTSVAALWVLTACRAQQLCPPQADVAPCRCVLVKRNLDVVCEFTDHTHISRALRQFKGKPSSIFYLKLQHDKLHKLTASTFLGLDVRYLAIRNSSLSVIEEASLGPLGGMLTQFDVSQNDLTKVPSAALKHLRRLFFLNMDYNRISVLHANAFSGLNSLKILSLFNNSIIAIHPTAFDGVAKHLTKLNLGRNKLTSVPHMSLAHLLSLTKLEMRENRITEIQEGDFAGLKNLIFLGLALNRLQQVPAKVFVHMTQLVTVELNGNGIDEIDVEAFAGLEESLQFLRLGNNQIRSVPGEALRRLHTLRHLDLSANNISYISEDAFVGYGDTITFLNLQKNQILSLPELTFDSLNSVTVLNLQNNRLMHIRKEVMDPILDTLRVVDITGNPLICDCKIQWYTDWLRDLKGNQRETMQKKHPVCTTRQGNQEYSLQNISPERMKCDAAASDKYPISILLPSIISFYVLFM